MRMVALGQAYSRLGGHVIFASVELPPMVEERLIAEGFTSVRVNGFPGSAEDAKNTAAVAHEVGAEWIAIDGYHFGGSFQKNLKSAGFSVLAMDDFGHAGHYWADLVINPNTDSIRSSYDSREAYTKLLLGAKYLLLRNEFLVWRDHFRQRQGSANALNVLVTFGGSDPTNVTGQVLQALAYSGIPTLIELTVLVGGANPHVALLSRIIRSASVPICLVQGTDDVASVMSTADVALSAAGTTAWELAAIGVPSLLFVTADNQWVVARELARNGAALNMGLVNESTLDELGPILGELLVDCEKRCAMRNKARQLVDGYGPARLSSILARSGLWLRKAQEHDIETLWYWANDPVTRANSFNPNAISWNTHVEWFENHIRSGKSLCYIASTPDDQLVGQARFDGSGKEAIISISIDTAKRNKGHGTRLIEMSTRQAILERGFETVSAFIKSDNLASIRAFERAGFRYIRAMSIRGTSAVEMGITRRTLLG